MEFTIYKCLIRWTVKLDMAWKDFFGKLLNLMISMSIVWASSLEKRTWGRRLLQKKSWVNIWPRKSGQEKRVQIISWSIISFPIVLFVNVPACAGNLNLCESTTNKALQSIQIKMIHTNFEMKVFAECWNLFASIPNDSVLQAKQKWAETL